MARSKSRFREGGIADTSLEVLGNVASFTDPMGIGWGKWARNRLGVAIGSDSYIPGLDEYTDAVSGLMRGTGKGIMRSIPGLNMVSDGVDNVAERVFQNEGREPLYDNQEKINATGQGVGQVAGSVVGGLLTGNVMGAVGGVTSGVSDIQQAYAPEVAPDMAYMYPDQQMQSNSGLPAMQDGGAVPGSSPSNLTDYGRPKVYKGQTHEGPNKGIPVDEDGNPSAQSGKTAVALTEDGEVQWNGYVFSNNSELQKKSFDQQLPMMQDGGVLPNPDIPPIIVHDKNDPRLRDYRDSLYLYNATKHHIGTNSNFQQASKNVIQNQHNSILNKYNNAPNYNRNVLLSDQARARQNVNSRIYYPVDITKTIQTRDIDKIPEYAETLKKGGNFIDFNIEDIGCSYTSRPSNLSGMCRSDYNRNFEGKTNIELRTARPRDVIHKNILPIGYADKHNFVYKKPVQPVEYQEFPTTRLPNSLPYEELDVNPSVNIPALSTRPELPLTDFKKYSAWQNLAQQGKPIGYMNMGTGKGRKEVYAKDMMGDPEVSTWMNSLPSYRDGGDLPPDYKKFERFRDTLPDNLRRTPYQYGSPNNQYDLYGYWDSFNKPRNFNRLVKDNPDYTPSADGLYHGISRNPNTGQVLKSDKHPTFYKGVSQDLPMGYINYQTPEGQVYSHQRQDIDESNVGAYYMPPLPAVAIREQAPKWLKHKTALENSYNRQQPFREQPFIKATDPNRHKLLEHMHAESREKWVQEKLADRLMKENPRGDKSLSKWKKSFTPQEMEILMGSKYNTQFDTRNSTLGKAVRNNAGHRISALGGPGSPTYKLRGELGMDDIDGAAGAFSVFGAALETPFNAVHGVMKGENMAEAAAGIHKEKPSTAERIVQDPLTYVGMGLGKSALKGANAVKGAKLSSSSVKNIPAKTTTKVAAKGEQPWQLEELPGLHLKSTMTGSPLEKQLSKSGEINVNNIKAYINKTDVGEQDKFILDKVLNERFAGKSKINYNEFRKAVSDELVPLNRKLGAGGQYADYGLTRLGFDETDRVLENKSLTYGNPSKFGRGSAEHFDESTLGHTRTLVTEAEPDVMHLLEQQSDYWQKVKNEKPVDFEKYKGILAKQEINHANNLKLLRQMKETGKDYAGNPVENYRIKQFEERINDQGRVLELRKGDIANPTQKNFLGKNHQERLLQENVAYAAKQGKLKVRVPTSETAAKVQGYSEKTQIKRKSIDLGDEFILEDNRKAYVSEIRENELGDIIAYFFKDSEKGYAVDERLLQKNYPNLFETMHEPSHQTILKKYSQQPKTIKKLYGVEPRTVTDSKGNTWYEFDIPKKFKQGKGEIKALEVAAPVAGAVGATPQRDITTTKKKSKAVEWEGYVFED